MASNPETRFGKRFRKKLKYGHDIRVENPACPGTPDLNDCINGVEFWVEFKQTKEMPKLPDTPVFRGALRPEQVLWLYKRASVGGRCYIAAYVEDLDITYIIPGKHAREFNSMNRAQLDSLNITMEAMWTSTGGKVEPLIHQKKPPR